MRLQRAMKMAVVLTGSSVVFVLAGAVPTAANAQQPAAASLVFDEVTVVDVERGELVPNQRVVIDGNRIRAVGGSGAVTIPQGVQIVNARGKYLIPGLWDMHVHPMHRTDVAYPMLVANGVTGMRDPGSSVPLDTLRLWRREILAGTRAGPPRQLLSGQSIAGPKSGCDRSKMREKPQTCVADSADARYFVAVLQAAGADMIKPRAVSRGLYFVIAAEARRLGIRFGGHADNVAAVEASDSGAAIVDHSHGFKRNAIDPLYDLCTRSVDTVRLPIVAKGVLPGHQSSGSIEQCRPVAERFKHNNTWWVPTLFVKDGSRGGGEQAKAIARRFPEAVGGFWQDSVHARNWLRDTTKNGDVAGARSPDSTADSLYALRIVQRVGMPILAGTDTYGKSGRWGFSLHAELAMYVAGGLTTLNALQSATLNPATMLHGTDSLGMVAAGKLADLVLLDANPLADITNTTTIRAVVANGRYFDRAALDTLLAEARAKSKE